MSRMIYLLIEDDEAQSCLLSKWLKFVAKPHEIEVLTANNLQDGIRISNEVKPSTTFLDLHLPLVPGGPVENDWRKVADHIPQMIPPVIAVTAMDVTPEMKLYCITQKGAQHVFQKPYNDDFFAKLRGDAKLFASRLLSAASDAELRQPQNG